MVALERADKSPYSADLLVKTEVGGVGNMRMSGRVNLNTEFTGRLELRTGENTPPEQAMRMEMVVTSDGRFGRDLDAEGGWQRLPKSETNVITDYAEYAKLLLGLGRSARKGVEERGGVTAYRLSGRLRADQIRAIDPSVHNSMRTSGVSSFKCDQWIDENGRTVRFEQWIDFGGTEGHNIATFADFGPAEKFGNPM
ncbi:LppX_LprAFG lipoprotein [Streptomyces sp. TP-A0874]|uniref:LppX_LprAFG lipoprotein n=1 Tax=Streptomyces sp. TP-A0874 TaxID=549819 RepID=UPI00111302AC|nr:LppX_LprAFG lipoprotein [Streptomyces sp. TP-A0874]